MKIDRVLVLSSIGACCGFGLISLYVAWNREQFLEEFPTEDYGLVDVTIFLCYRLVVNMIGSLFVVPVAFFSETAKGTAKALIICQQEAHWLVELLRKIFEHTLLRRLWDFIVYYCGVLGACLEWPFRLTVRYCFYVAPLVAVFFIAWQVALRCKRK